MPQLSTPKFKPRVHWQDWWRREIIVGEALDASRVCPQLVRPKNPHLCTHIDCRCTHSPGTNSTDSFKRRLLQSQRRCRPPRQTAFGWNGTRLWQRLRSGETWMQMMRFRYCANSSRLGCSEEPVDLPSGARNRTRGPSLAKGTRLHHWLREPPG